MAEATPLPISFILVITQENLPQTRPSLHEKLKCRGSAQRSPWLVETWLGLEPVTARRVASVQWPSLWPAGRWTLQHCGSLEIKQSGKCVIERLFVVLSLQRLQSETSRCSLMCCLCRSDLQTYNNAHTFVWREWELQQFCTEAEW